MREGNYRSHLQATRGLRYSHSSLPHWTLAYLLSITFIGMILSSSNLKYTKLDLWSIADTDHHHVLSLICFKYLSSEKHQSSLIWWKCIYFIFQSKFEKPPTLCVMLTGGSVIPYEGSYVISALLNSISLHFTQVNKIIKILIIYRLRSYFVSWLFATTNPIGIKLSNLIFHKDNITYI